MYTVIEIFHHFWPWFLSWLMDEVCFSTLSYSHNVRQIPPSISFVFSILTLFLRTEGEYWCWYLLAINLGLVLWILLRLLEEHRIFSIDLNPAAVGVQQSLVRLIYSLMRLLRPSYFARLLDVAGWSSLVLSPLNCSLRLSFFGLNWVKDAPENRDAISLWQLRFLFTRSFLTLLCL